MNVTALLRTAAFATALAGVIDPTWTTRQRAPLAVEIKSSPDAATTADDVRRRLMRSLEGEATFDSDAGPAAIVLVGGLAPPSSLAGGGLPISTVSIPRPSGPNVWVVSADGPDPVRVGWSATVRGVIEARGFAGRTSRIVLEERGAELVHVEHQWTRDLERFDVALRYTPPGAATSTVTLRAVPLDGEATSADNAADLRLVASGERLEVLVYEPRPSWNATFVRRALEEDPTFDVSAVVRASKGLEVRAGTPPPALTADALNPFAAVLVGAPEELSASEVEALRAFARRRGGAVVLLPDRRPSGRFLDLIRAPQFDEVLLETAVELVSAAGPRVRASELAVLRADVPGSDVLASYDSGKGPRPIVIDWPTGAGRVVFSGALDAWRTRAAADDGFARFWRVRVAEAALAAPARLEVSVRPGVPRPAEPVTIRVRIRQTEFEEAPGRTRVPAVQARLVAPDGTERPIRLWPAAEPGVFEGSFTGPAPGTYDLQVRSSTGATVDEVVHVAAEARHPLGALDETDQALRLIATSTGGVSVDATDLTPLERHLRSLQSGEVARTIRPARSLAVLTLFVTLLCAEWTIRRRRGGV
jgi:hypothetical protein